MKKQITIYLLLLFSLQIFAQEDIADYKQFETLSKKINNIQRTADGKNFKHENSDGALHFPENNFVFNYHDFSATWIYGEEKERAIIENIDLANVHSIVLPDESFGDLRCVVISFPKEQKTVIVNDSKVKSGETKDIAFYFPAIETVKGNEMFDALTELIYLTKVKKGILTSQQAKQQQDNWKTARNTNTATAYYDFLRKEPNTIFTQMAYVIVENLDPTIKIITDKYSGFYLGMPKKEFEDIITTRVKNVGNEKIDKKLKLFIDNFAMNFYTYEETKSLYHFENIWIGTYKTHHNAGSIIYYSIAPELGIDGKSYGTGNFTKDADKLGLSWNKNYKLINEELPNLAYRVANIESTVIENKFFPNSRSSILSEIIFNQNDYACQMTFSFILSDYGNSYDSVLSDVKKVFGTSFKEGTHNSIVEGKSIYFDKGRYYVLAKVVKEYNSPLLLTLTFYTK